MEEAAARVAVSEVLACAAGCAVGSGLAIPPTRGVPSQLLRFIIRPRIPTSSAASSNSVSSMASCAR